MLLVVGWVTLRPVLLNLGSTSAERSAAMPGGATVGDTRTVRPRSVTLDGPPAEVWPWLVQMGVGKGRFYDYDWGESSGPARPLDDIRHDDIRNADRVHPEWQDLQVGDYVSPFPGATSWKVTEVVPRGGW